MAMHEQIYIHFVCLKVIHKKKKEDISVDDI